MPSFEEKAIFRQVNYIKNKFHNVKKETDCVISLLQNCLLVFDQRIVECIESDSEGFSALYRKLNNDIEDFQEKLFYIQASIEVPTADKQVPKSTLPKDTIVTKVKEDVPPQIPPPQGSNVSLENSSSSTISHHINEPCSVDQNTKVKSIYSSRSTSYASLNDIESTTCDITKSSIVFPPVTENNSFLNSTCEADQNALVKSEPLQQIIGSVTSIESLSRSSCYRSLSSSISDLCYQSAASGPQNLENNISDVSSIRSDFQYNQNESHTLKVISPLKIMLPLKTTAILTHVENPGNFWLQLEDIKTNTPCYPKEKFLQSNIPNCVKEGDFFLAPSKSVPFYLRAKVLSYSQKDQSIKVLFVDNGSSSTVHIKELRILPAEAYNIPMQAINCFLAEISAKNNIWCYAAINKLKDFSANSLDAHIKTCDGDKYGVQLKSTVSVLFDDDFSCDIGESLCNDGFAVENAPSEVAEDCTSLPVLCDNVKMSLNQISNQLSCDSGVSVSSKCLSNPRSSAEHYNSDVLNSTGASSQLVLNEDIQSCETKGTPRKNQTEKYFGDLISFESIDEIDCEDVEQSEEQFNPYCISYIKCLKICTCECPLHLIIPMPSITFVTEDMVLVMLSHIVNPSEFYINMAMESSITLDELLENMNIVYNTPKSPIAFSVLLDDLKEGMFCAAYFEDGNWYRVKVLSKHLKFDQSPNVFVQYVDYGNKAWIKNTDLRTLTPEFSKLPSFSVKCSLAGVVPVQPSGQPEDKFPVWDEKSIEAFKNLIGFENCLTAQICDRRTIWNDDPLQILLWDTQGKQDVLINQVFVDTGLAEFNYTILEKLLTNQVKKQSDVEILNHWDPMKDEYNDVQNSYGVNVDDFQVAVNGYKHNDEEYICKYFSLRGHCPRIRCPFEHVSLGEGGVTRDQEELYSLNSCPPLPIPNTWILLQVCAVISPTHFYAQLPFGNQTVDELDSLIHKGVAKEKLRNQEVPALFQALNEHYNHKPFDEKTTVALSYGSIVVSKRQQDQTWHRGRIVDVHDVTAPAKVFYVDFGNEEWVERRNIRQIQPEFLHCPFQAVECSLYDVEPLGFEKGEKWSIQAMSCFKKLATESIMLAYVADICNDVLQVSLRRTTEADHRTIKDHLIREGFGQDKTLVVKKKPQTKYVPG